MHAFELNHEVPAAEIIPASATEPPFIPGTPPQIIEFFPPDWHPGHGKLLSFFPRSLPAAEWHPQGYWPDFSTLLDDRATSQLAYFPVGASAFCAHVVYEKCGFYRILEYRDATIVGRGEAVSFGAALALMLAERVG